MDDECDIVDGQYRCGLVGYRRLIGIRSHEVAWSRGIAAHLAKRGYEASNECRYPDHRKKCDVVVTLADRSRVWLEVKPTWRAWINSKLEVEFNAKAFYRGYLFGPLESGLPRSHSIAQDIDKLGLLRKPDADFVGLLILGFDVPNGELDTDLQRLFAMKEMNKNAWLASKTDVWPDRNSDQINFSSRVWWEAT